VKIIKAQHNSKVTLELLEKVPAPKAKFKQTRNFFRVAYNVVRKYPHEKFYVIKHSHYFSSLFCRSGSKEENC
jgi:hypothetical protein